MAIRGDIKDEEKNSIVLTSFQGGMRRDVDPSELNDNEYVHGQNIRVRDGYVRPIKYPQNISNSIPEGKKQGIYGFDSILVVFNGGKAYAIDYSLENAQYSLIFGFQMDEMVDRIYAQDVPASWMNFERKLNDTTDITNNINFLSQIAGTPSALVCQDGISRPNLIFSTGSARIAKDITEWNNSELEKIDTREYVPIGKQMLYHPDGILFILSPDGKEIYRSVTGRPLDFVIAIDGEGNKLTPLTSGKPEASRMGYNLDYSSLNVLYNVNSAPRVDSEGSGFFVGAQKKSWIVYPSYAQLIYNEPRFRNQTLFASGPLNQDSIGEASGDTVLINESGPMTFNAIGNFQNEGKNSPFYKPVSKLFDRITQTTTCIGMYDDYTLFAVNTLHGQGVLVYDNLTQSFVSLDIYPEVIGVIKQFALIKVRGIKRLFFITTGDQLFEAFAGTTAEWKIYSREASSVDTEKELIPRRFRITLANILEDGMLSLQEFVDRRSGSLRSRAVKANTILNIPPISIPFGESTSDTIENASFPLEIPLKGEKVGVLISGNFDCELQKIQMILEGDEQAITDSEKGKAFTETRGSL